MKKRTLNFQKGGGLMPVIIQDDTTGAVLMLGYMNRRAFEATKNTGVVTFWSRSRHTIWVKGLESGNRLKVASISADCDGDAILIRAELVGSAVCHTGSYSCFFNDVSL